MTDRPVVSLADLPPNVRQRLVEKTGLRVRAPRRAMSKDAVRTCAIRVLAVVADLKPAERSRVFRQAERMNAV